MPMVATKTHTIVFTNTMVAVAAGSILVIAAAAMIMGRFDTRVISPRAADTIAGGEANFLEVAVQGDFNGDNFPDVAACPGGNYGHSSVDVVGGASIFFGSRGQAAIDGDVAIADADVTIAEEPDWSTYGINTKLACAAGDVNGDGIDDLIVGAEDNNAGYTDTGAVYVVLGSTTLASGSLSTAIKFSGEAGNDNAGVDVAVGDVNGDRLDDIVIGSIGDSVDLGTSYVVLGSRTLASSSLSTAIKFTGVSGDRAGEAVAVGDTNGDHIDDIVLGAAGDDDGGTSAGATYVVLGRHALTNVTLSTSTAAKLIGEAPGYSTGVDVAAGDVNGDHIDDVIIGSVVGSSYNAETYIIFGTTGTIAGSGIPSGSLSTGILLAGEAVGDWATSVAAGDINGDGIEDVIIGAMGNSDGGTSAGAVYVVLGEATWSSDHYNLFVDSKIRKFIGKGYGDSLGHWVGYLAGSRTISPQVVLGAHGNEDADGAAGKIWLYSNLPTSAEGYTRTVR